MGVRAKNIEKLILATIQEIETQGVDNVRVRAIVDAAQMNVSAVSYYFGSKEALIDASLAQTLVHLHQDLASISEALESNPVVAAQELLSYLADGVRRYPRVSMVHFSRTTDSLSHAFAPAVEILVRAVRRERRFGDKRARLRATQALSALLMPLLFPSVWLARDAFDDPEYRQGYLDEIVKSLFA